MNRSSPRSPGRRPPSGGLDKPPDAPDNGPSRRGTAPGWLAGLRSVRSIGASSQLAPARPRELTPMASEAQMPYMADSHVVDRGKMARYTLCWINPRGGTGPWSLMITATIGA